MRGDPMVNLRLPPELKQQVVEAAQAHRRSITAEITSRLEASFGQVGTPLADTPLKTGRESDQLKLRLPDGLRATLAQGAERNGRSMNAEIVALVQTALASGEGGLLKRVEAIEAQLAARPAKKS